MTESTTTATDAPGRAAVERYVAFWNARTEGEQRRAASAAFAEGVGYHVPLGVMRGTDELIGFRSEFADRLPEFRFQPRTEPDTHHDRARLQWELVVEGKSFAAGTDVLELDEAGRIVAVTGFVDRAPAGFDPDAHHR
jgi:SnoaL-like domain